MRILLVEDEIKIANFIERGLKEERYAVIDKTTILKIADLELDQVKHRVKRGGKEIILTAKEYGLLEYLMLHANQVVTRTMISDHVWNEDFDSFTNITDVYVNYIRNKIDKGFDKILIHTIRGVGYILKE